MERKEKNMEKKNNLNKGNRVFLTTSRSSEEVKAMLMDGVTQVSRPTMMDNKTENKNVLYGGLEENVIWLMQGTENKSGFAPQRIFSGSFSRQEENTLVFGTFGFARGFHLIWFLCTVIGGVFMLMMLQNVAVAIATAALCVVCWVAATIGGCTKYKEEEKAVRRHLERVCAETESLSEAVE